MLAFWLTCKILVTSDAETHKLLLAGHKHATIIDFAYLFVNDQWKLSRNKGKTVLKFHLKLIKNTHTFVKSRGVWVGLDWKDVYALLGEIQKTVILGKATVILLYIHSRTMTGHYSFLRRPGSSCFCE